VRVCVRARARVYVRVFVYVFVYTRARVYINTRAHTTLCGASRVKLPERCNVQEAVITSAGIYDTRAQARKVS